jgi:hypothetical protein
MAVVDAEWGDEEATADDQVVIDDKGGVGDRKINACGGVAVRIGGDADVCSGLDEQAVVGLPEKKN